MLNVSRMNYWNFRKNLGYTVNQKTAVNSFITLTDLNRFSIFLLLDSAVNTQKLLLYFHFPPNLKFVAALYLGVYERSN